MMGRSFVRRCDPEQHRFAKRHGKEIDSHGKLCRHRADQPRAAGSIRIANAIVSYAEYIGKLLFPAKLAIMYPYRQTLSPVTIVACAILLIAITIAALLLRKRAPYFTIGWLWFAGTLVPVIGIVQVGGQAMADRYSYIPSIGLTIAIVWLIADFVRNRVAVVALASVALIAFAILTFIQTGYWRDTLTLFTHAVDVTPRNPTARKALGREYLFHDDYEHALEQFRANNGAPFDSGEIDIEPERTVNQIPAQVRKRAGVLQLLAVRPGFLQGDTHRERFAEFEGRCINLR